MQVCLGVSEIKHPVQNEKYGIKCSIINIHCTLLITPTNTPTNCLWAREVVGNLLLTNIYIYICKKNSLLIEKQFILSTSLLKDNPLPPEYSIL